MLKKEQQDKLKLFLESVNQVTHALSPEVREPLYDLGLIIIEPDSKAKTKDILSVFPDGKAEILEYESKNDASFAEKMADLINDKRWVFIELNGDPGHNLINQLRLLSEQNVMQLLDYKGSEIYNLKLPLESRIVVVVKRDVLEKEISYPNFLNIFGPVLSLS